MTQARDLHFYHLGDGRRAVLTLSDNVYHNFINAIRSEVTIMIVYAVIKYYNITLTANGIDATMRGVLEQYIDSIVIAIPNIVQVFFDASKKAQLQIQNEKDFALGVALGNIQNAFLTTFVSTQARYPSPEELTQIGNVIFSEYQRYEMQYSVQVKSSEILSG